MRKILALAMALAMVLLIPACGKSGNGASSAAPQSSGALSDNENVAGAVSGEVRTGLGTVISLADSKSANDEKPAAAQANVTMCAASFDEDGAIISVSIDTAQCKIAYDEKGQLTTDVDAAVQTKKQLGDNYGMKQVSGIGKEWYEQIEALEKWMTGKTVDQVLGMKVTDKEDHPSVPDEADLTSSVTISVGEYLEALKAAYNNAG